MTKIRDYIESEDLHYLAETDITELERRERLGYCSGKDMTFLARQWNDAIHRQILADSKACAAANGDAMSTRQDSVLEALDNYTAGEIAEELSVWREAANRKQAWDKLTREEKDAEWDAIPE